MRSKVRTPDEMWVRKKDDTTFTTFLSWRLLYCNVMQLAPNALLLPCAKHAYRMSQNCTFYACTSILLTTNHRWPWSLILEAVLCNLQDPKSVLKKYIFFAMMTPYRHQTQHIGYVTQLYCTTRHAGLRVKFRFHTSRRFEWERKHTLVTTRLFSRWHSPFYGLSPIS